MQTVVKLGLAAFALAGAASAQAATSTYFGTTVGKPTFDRPLAGSPPNSLSGVGTAVNYDTYAFSVDAGGSYSFALNAVFDNYLFLYGGSFNPVSPLANALIGDDDSGGNGNAAFAYTLQSGTSYVAVATSFANGDAGSYALTINGPGNVGAPNAAAPLPEPATWAMLVGGFGMIGSAMRRRTSTSFA